MARRRGWNGHPPTDDAEATERIVTAATELMEQTQATISLADVAQSLGVIRQTVYRYFPTADALMSTAALRTVDALIAQLADRARGITDPADAVVEIIVGAVTLVPRNSQMRVLLAGPQAGVHSTAVLSAGSIAFGHTMIAALDVDWPAHGYADADVDELAEYLLRVLHSFLVAPAPDRTPEELRRFLARWVAPAIKP
ncbi:TetR/AcrR family transcriptional regulator [Gordonia sp. (in: high G+C Gram-positive bacteria)]|uniref:TetR/AcrR family transcriptional regulator n=1 Tax=Gordonia sp. (in: high G+C Gram-positive bacteria) TaxID=84139 RepID=UPI0016B02245|nr:TetR/AcrR family transcriptional regulator [Gordonia sp. (in: high G+C Gram-positive bacteria)]NLG47672.1 TetR/AcrR family transcriptional regulator [Gordonia sp. (in: high G+C Gram-positive bacteria)]